MKSKHTKDTDKEVSSVLTFVKGLAMEDFARSPKLAPLLHYYLQDSQLPEPSPVPISVLHHVNGS